MKKKSIIKLIIFYLLEIRRTISEHGHCFVTNRTSVRGKGGPRDYKLKIRQNSTLAVNNWRNNISTWYISDKMPKKRLQRKKLYASRHELSHRDTRNIPFARRAMVSQIGDKQIQKKKWQNKILFYLELRKISDRPRYPRWQTQYYTRGEHIYYLRNEQ